MKELTLAQAERDFAAVIAAVEQGEDVVLTRNGRPVIRMSRAAAAPAARSPTEIAAIEAAVERAKEIQGRTSSDPIDWRELVEDGRA